MKQFIYLIFISFICASCTCPTFDINSSGPNIIAIGKKFRINLPEDHRSGYTWQLTDDYDKTIIDHTNTVWEGNSNGVYFYFVGTKNGIATLNFTSRKYDDINSLKSITIKISEN